MLVQNLTNPLQQCNLKFASNAGEFEGYASVFGSNDAVNDTIVRGAFSKSLASGRLPAMFINHNHRDIPVGDWVDMKEDDTGLYAVGRIDLNHRDGPSLYSAMKSGRMTGLSIGFTMGAQDFDRKESGGRVIKNVALKETSVVTFPCEDNARISAVKAEIESFESLNDFQRWLSNSLGLSRAEALAWVGRFKSVVLSNSGDDDDERIIALKKQVMALQAEINAARLIRVINSGKEN